MPRDRAVWATLETDGAGRGHDNSQSGELETGGLQHRGGCISIWCTCIIGSCFIHDTVFFTYFTS